MYVQQKRQKGNLFLKLPQHNKKKNKEEETQIKIPQMPMAKGMPRLRKEWKQQKNKKCKVKIPEKPPLNLREKLEGGGEV